MKIEPIKPSECFQEFPDWIIKGTNLCIKDHYKNHSRSSHFTQNELIEYILAEAPQGVSRNMLFDNNWLDIEDIYRKVGWEVEYDKPGYCETYEANFTFKYHKNK